MRNLVFVVLLFMCTLLCSFSQAWAAGVSLAAAASLKDVLNELTDRYAGRTPAVKFVSNFSGSGALARQIENGAPADIFISANQQWLDYLRDKGLLNTAESAVFARNSLVFAGTTRRKVVSMQNLSELDRIAIGSPRSVPAGEYALAAIKGAGLARQLEKKLVMARDVRECMMYADRGEVDGAFVYRTDALLSRQARILFVVPQELYPPVIYPMALTAKGGQNRDAVAFYAFLLSPEARTVLLKYGFIVK